MSRDWIALLVLTASGAVYAGDVKSPPPIGSASTVADVLLACDASSVKADDPAKMMVELSSWSQCTGYLGGLTDGYLIGDIGVQRLLGQKTLDPMALCYDTMTVDDQLAALRVALVKKLIKPEQTVRLGLWAALYSLYPCGQDRP